MVMALALLVGSGPAGATCAWPAWQAFKANLISADGRVMDASGGSAVTTSEGQAYALFFALVANDRPEFTRLLEWTTDNLAAGDLAQRLPAWKWGRAADGQWRVLDANNASDADLWLAYDLLEAGRLWHAPAYTRLATHVLWRSAAVSIARVPGLGLTLLPGAAGFVADNGWRLNPSYLVPQLFARFALVDPVWADVGKASNRLLEVSAPHGFAPDWVDWTRTGQLAVARAGGATGSYGAIRVYLWLGMLAQDAPGRAALQAHFAPMAALVARLGHVPATVDAAGGKAEGVGPPGFTVALLPLLRSRGDDAAVAVLQRGLQAHPIGPHDYYAQALALFGAGWLDGRYRFDAQGRLLPAWRHACAR